MNSRGAAALAALTAASALLAYVLFRKKEPKVKVLDSRSWRTSFKLSRKRW